MRAVKPNGAQPEKGLGRSKSRAGTERLVGPFHHAHSSSALRKVTAQMVLPVGKARTLPRSSFSQSAYLVITSRRRSTAVILR